MEESGKKVFILDDDQFLLDMYTTKFKERGFAVSSFFSVNELLGALRDGSQPDMILMDLVMPGMDGFELLETIKNESLATDSVIIILSNLGQKEDQERGQKLGAHGYIIKANNTPTEVVEKVEETYKKVHS